MPQNPHIPEDLGEIDELHLWRAIREYEVALAILSRSRDAADIRETILVAEAIEVVLGEIGRRQRVNAA